ncbi:DUF4880 domain-containing protein [Providencia rettgeri]|nr:DUF4880 domain-containing protein [Providencia rettgeri]
MTVSGTDRSRPNQVQLEHAVALLVRMHGGCPQRSQEAREQLEQWRHTAPAHEAAYRLAQNAWNAADFQDLQGDIPLPGDQGKRQGRRRALQALTLGALAVLGSTYFRGSQQGELTLVTVRTQVLQRNLRDGSVLTMAPLSRLNWYSDDQQRLIELEEGEIHIDVARDAARPFIVRTNWGQVRVLGTAFSVERSSQGMRVVVERGLVQVEHAQTQAGQLRLSAGQAAVVDEHGLRLLQASVGTEVAAWREGWLVFENRSLAEVVAAWNRYLPAPLVLGPEPVLSTHHLTGRFPINDPKTFLLSLSGILPVRLEALPHGGWMIRSAV